MSEVNPLGEFFRDHLRELRRRAMLGCGAILLFSGVAYAFAEPLTALLLKPIFRALPDLKGLVYTNLPEAFVAYLKVSVMAGLAAALPVVCYQIWRFVSPGLVSSERRLALFVSFWAALLFLGGVFFAYLVVLPEMLSFMLGLAGERLQAMPRLDAYLAFVSRTVLAFGLAFEIPFLMVAAGRTGLVAPGYFRKKRWFSYLGIAVLAFLLVGGDPLGALLLTGPLVLLYEAGVLLTALTGRRR
jgi:sec-independent protein translocase protein TatC